MKRIRHVAGLALITLMARPSEAQGFRHVARYRGLGGLVASAVQPGQRPGTERLYLSYLYLDHTIDVVAVDPDAGKYNVFSNPAPTESRTVHDDGSGRQRLFENLAARTLPQAGCKSRNADRSRQAKPNGRMYLGRRFWP